MGCRTCSKVSDNLEGLSAASAVDLVGHFISFFHFYQYFAQILQQPEDLVKSFGGYSRSACEGGKAEVQIFELDIWTSHLEMQIFSWKSRLVQESRSPTGLDVAGRGQL